MGELRRERLVCPDTELQTPSTTGSAPRQATEVGGCDSRTTPPSWCLESRRALGSRRCPHHAGRTGHDLRSGLRGHEERSRACDAAVRIRPATNRAGDTPHHSRPVRRSPLSRSPRAGNTGGVCAASSRARPPIDELPRSLSSGVRPDGAEPEPVRTAPTRHGWCAWPTVRRLAPPRPVRSAARPCDNSPGHLLRTGAASASTRSTEASSTSSYSMRSAATPVRLEYLRGLEGRKGDASRRTKVGALRPRMAGSFDTGSCCSATTTASTTSSAHSNGQRDTGRNRRDPADEASPAPYERLLGIAACAPLQAESLGNGFAFSPGRLHGLFPLREDRRKTRAVATGRTHRLSGDGSITRSSRFRHGFVTRVFPCLH